MQYLLELYKTDRCNSCYDEYYVREMKTEDNKKYCAECWGELFFICHNCDESRDKNIDGYHAVNSSEYCNDCFDECFFICEGCDGTYLIDQSFDFNGEIYCEDCYNENFRMCCTCNEVVPYDDARYVSDSYYCIGCWEETFCECIHCRGIVYREDTYEGYCEMCWEEVHGDIKPYDYKPTIEFFGKAGDKLYLGFEIEAENVEDVEPNSEIACSVNNDLFYCKQDGSIDNGFEVVSHPMSFNYIQGVGREKIKNMLRYLRDSGMRSYDTETCGMHVHMSKKAIGNLTLFKLLKLFYENQEFVQDFSRRTLRNFNEYATLDDENGYVNKKGYRYRKAKEKYTDNRFLALNLCNHNTLEIRIFRGTLKPKSFFRNIEFCHAAVQFCRHASIRGITVSAFKKYTINNKKLYPNLAKYLTEGG